MSRVYRYDEAITRPQPTPQDFTAEIAFAKASLTAMCEEDTISGAFIYGPVSAEPTPRSDIDIMVSTPEIDLATAQSLHAMTNAIYERSGIPVDVSCHSEEDLTTGQHGFFHEHVLAWFGMLANERPDHVIGKSPLGIIKPPQTDLLVYMDGKFRSYAHEFEYTLMGGHYAHPELTLEKILNLPSRAGRHALGALMVRGFIPPGTLKSSQKSTVDAAVENLFGAMDPAIMTPYRRINASTGAYDDLLSRTSGGNVARQEYDATVRQLVETGLPDAIALTGKIRQTFCTLAGLPGPSTNR